MIRSKTYYCIFSYILLKMPTLDIPPPPPPNPNSRDRSQLLSQANNLFMMNFRADPTCLLGGVELMFKFQDYLISREFLEPINRSGIWDLQLILALRRMLVADGFVNDETHGRFFKDEVDYPRWARRRRVGVMLTDFPTTCGFQKVSLRLKLSTHLLLKTHSLMTQP